MFSVAPDSVPVLFQSAPDAAVLTRWVPRWWVTDAMYYSQNCRTSVLRKGTGMETGATQQGVATGLACYFHQLILLVRDCNGTYGDTRELRVPVRQPLGACYPELSDYAAGGAGLVHLLDRPGRFRRPSPGRQSQLSPAADRPGPQSQQ